MKKNNNILIFSIAYYPFVGGAEVAWKEITDRISDFNFDMITPRYDKKLPKIEKIGNVTVYRVGFGIKIDKLLLPILGPIKAFFLNRKMSYCLSIGIIYNHAGLAATFFKYIQPKIPFLLNLQDGDTDDVINRNTRGIQAITDLIYIKPDVITTIATFLTERAKSKGFKGNFQLIPNGVDISKFSKQISDDEKNAIRSRLKMENDDKMIITTSRLNYKNAIEDVINSLIFLPNNFKFIIIGNGEEEEKLKSLTKKLSLTSRVTFLGYMPHDEMIPYLKSSDFFCRPSLQEGLGNSFLEAMMAGVPVIATPVGGIPDFLINGSTGIFCNIKDSKSIAEGILKLDEDKNLRDNIIINAKVAILNKYDWDKVSESYNNLFKTI